MITAMSAAKRAREYICTRSNQSGAQKHEKTMVPAKAPSSTDPYRPTVGLTSSDDAQLVVKRRNKLPAGMKSYKSECNDIEIERAQGVRPRRLTCRDHPR
jgi:hypothetical protein